MSKALRSPKSDDTTTLSRRRFLQAGLAAAATASASFALPHDSGEAATAQPTPRDAPPAPPKGKRPNFLILLCDQMRFPPVYESEATKAFRQEYLKTQNLLRANGVEFQRHYAASAACVPSRASILTGHYPSFHGASQTTGGTKEPFDAEAFWLDPDAVPTFGDYFRAVGYRTYWRGKWHASAADLFIPGTHTPLPSYNTSTGEPDAAAEALYTAADRLDPYGFSGWIGPEPHGKSPFDSGSSVPGQHGRDEGFAQQAKSLIEQLDHDRSAAPWVVVCSFVNPHDIALWGMWANLGFGPTIEFKIEEDVVPKDLFDLALFQQSVDDDLATKPSAQACYQETYHKWMQPILDDPVLNDGYYRYYYQLHKNVDEQMMVVLQALLDSRYKDDTIVVLTSDHGELLGSHYDMHQKWYQAYDEALRVPLIIWNSKLFSGPRPVETLTSHVDLAPTLLGLAGIDPEPIRQQLALSHSDARPLVGRDLSPLILGQVDPAGVNDPIYFMTDDDITRGPNQDNVLGFPYSSVIQPNHVETVIARLDHGKVWKYTRYFDNPQFWSSPGNAGEDGVEDVILQQKLPNPPADSGPHLIPCEITVKATPKPEEFEMYNVTDDPMELHNRYGDPTYLSQQMMLSQLLQEQCAQKRLIPCSGDVPGQPDCDQEACSK